VLLAVDTRGGTTNKSRKIHHQQAVTSSEELDDAPQGFKFGVTSAVETPGFDGKSRTKTAKRVAKKAS
jgi:hypothetical protein